MGKSKSTGKTWDVRITGYGVKAASEFSANPNNWRLHPEEQRQAVMGSLDTLGWIDVVIENSRTGYLIDGHERLWEALKCGEKTPVPYIQVDLSEEEEAQALATLDPITGMARPDREKLNELIHSIQSDDARVQAMIAEIARQNGLYEDGEQPDDQDKETLESVLDQWRTAPGQVWSYEGVGIAGTIKLSEGLDTRTASMILDTLNSLGLSVSRDGDADEPTGQPDFSGVGW